MVKSVDRALTIIQLVSKHKEGLGVTELSSHLDINKSSVYKLLSTLANHGFIEQDKVTKRYRLGYKYLELSSILLESIDIRSEAYPFLEELENLTNEVVHLVVYDQEEIIYIEKLEGNETLRTHSKIGRRAPAHCTSVGKVILAHLPEREINLILDKYGLPKHTENTIVEKEAFLKELEKVKVQGYAVEIEENEVGISCIAVPIFDHLGNVIAAVSISAPTLRMTAERIEKLESIIREKGRSISHRLGYVIKD